jgi:hypothetical protein
MIPHPAFGEVKSYEIIDISLIGVDLITEKCCIKLMRLQSFSKCG